MASLPALPSFTGFFHCSQLLSQLGFDRKTSSSVELKSDFFSDLFPVYLVLLGFSLLPTPISDVT